MLSRIVWMVVCLFILGTDFVWGQSRPNILWITCEDVSPVWGCYGDPAAYTPNIDRLAKIGYRFDQVFSNAPICAPARSTLITGMYATSLGTQNLRSEIPIPADLRILPEMLAVDGYFTSNNAKTDYNFAVDGRWNDLGNKAHWRNRTDGQPFFSVFNFGITHEGHANRDDPADTQTLEKKHEPSSVPLPPYYPDTEEFRRIIAHQYDLISVFDQEVGKLIAQLDEDGLTEETIIFIFSDHGFGLPRYKRWLYDTGLRVPLVIYFPEKFRSMAPRSNKKSIDDLIGFVDFAPTVLAMTGTNTPETMQGRNFLGDGSSTSALIFGYRDRADDVYDMSRSVFDGRFLFIRHFMPQNPYIQDAIIFNRDKRSFVELRKLKSENSLPAESLKMFQRKPVEELYDLNKDPQELINLAELEDYAGTGDRLRRLLFDHMLTSFDSGLMNEADMMHRAQGLSVYDVVRNELDITSALKSADQVGKVRNPDQLKPYLDHSDPAVRYWALVALDAFEGDLHPWRSWLIEAVKDTSLSNRVLAAQILINKLEDHNFLSVLTDALEVQNEPALLQAAIAVRNIGSAARPLVSKIKSEIYPRIQGEIWGRYKSWSYPMFIGMALDQTLENCR